MLRFWLICRFNILLAPNILILQQILRLLPWPVKLLSLVLITQFRPYHLASSGTFGLKIKPILLLGLNLHIQVYI